jgi:hypothetical protein
VRQENDLAGYNEDLDRVQRAKQWDQVQLTKAKIASCDHGKFVTAENTLLRLESEAAGIIKQALSRLIESFDSELIQYSAQRESELLAFDLPLFIDDMKDGKERRHWVLWDDKIATSLQSCREVSRNRLQAFNHPNYRTAENNSRFAISTLVFLCTDEDINFSWMG